MLKMSRIRLEHAPNEMLWQRRWQPKALQSKFCGSRWWREIKASQHPVLPAVRADKL
jgi:hypothetical protein